MKLSTTLAHKFYKSPSFRKEMFDFSRRQHKEQIPDFEAYLLAQGKTEKDYFVESEYLIAEGLGHCTIYLVRETALEIAAKISVKEEMTFQYLEKVPKGDFAFIESKHSFYKFLRIDDWITVLYLKEDDTHCHYDMFNFCISKGWSSIPDNDRGKECVHKFLQLIIFWQFAEPEVIVLDEGRKVGTKKEGKILNDAPFRVRMMDSTWNKIIIRTEGFDVDGHMRLQPCGKENKDRKLIWINPFKKKGYIRKGGSNKAENVPLI